jgi:hypothetical protein
VGDKYQHMGVTLRWHGDGIGKDRILANLGWLRESRQWLSFR